MDLMTLAAKLTLDDSGFRSGISNAESAGQNLAGRLSSMTVAVGNIMSDVIKKGFSTVKDMVGGAVNAYADYQQLIGGVETLFKKDADKVAAYAKEAYRTAGLSANEYMETVTSFSASLLQGLKGDTAQAAEISNMAITDMADNANKMGTDMSSIQTAYQGFAKQNYTMLDNLKLGYGGTKEEMLRLVNESGVLQKKVESLDEVSFDQIIKAIHEVQEQMGITGTTAEEADKTISGSAASMKSAWQDLLTAIGGGGDEEGLNLDKAIEKFKASFGTYMENFIPALTQTIANSGSLVEAVAGAVASLPEDLLANVGSAALEGGTGMLNGAKSIVHWLITNIANVFKTASVDTTDIATFGEALGNFLGSTISDLVTNAPAIIEGVFAAGVALAGSFIQGLFGGIFGGPEVDAIQEKLGKELFTIDKQTTEANAILDYMEKLVKKYGEAATNTSEWKSAEDELEKILGGAGDVFEAYGGDIDGAIKKLKEMNAELRRTAIMEALSGASAEAWELYAQQTLEYERQKYRYESGQSKQETYTENTRQEVMKAAEQKAAEMFAQHNDGQGNYTGNDNDYYNFLNVAKGFTEIGGELVKLSDMDFSELQGLIDLIADSDLTKGYEDDKKLYDEAQAQIDDAKAKMADAQKEMEATKTMIDELEASVGAAAEDLLKSAGIAGTSIETGGTIAEAAFKSFAARVNSIQIKTAIGDSTPAGRYLNPNLGNFGPNIPAPAAENATGMDYVPYDGYRTVLHKGEAVLTRDQNARRGGMSYEDMEQALTDAIERGMEHLYINMSGEKVADITTRRTASNISANEHARTRAMGG